MTMAWHEDDTKLKIVRLLDPTLCYGCSFSKMAQVEMIDGAQRRMMHCKRLDCDNWQVDIVSEVPRTLQEDTS